MANSKGFSLIELMVVVGILAILSTIAIPSYRGFQARARQKEGFALMSAYYTAAHNAKTGFNIFPGNFVQTGFQPVGQLGYRLSAADNNSAEANGINMVINDDACFTTQAVCECAGNCAGFKKWEELPLGGGGILGPAITTAACPVLAPAAGPNTVTNGTFQIVVAGVIDTRAATQDRLTMNHLKQVQVCEDGIY